MPPMSPANPHTVNEWAHQIDAVDLEIIQLALLCQVRLLDLTVLGHILDNNTALIGVEPSPAFAKLRGLLFLHFAIEEKLASCSSEADARSLVRSVQERLSHRLGPQLDQLR
ncbi:hypothetical protein OU995_01840 [Roseateles sp. SL47]|uniref:hypothetical protein n=1 Tax=Roseateles sp. SL47 TaxID=2995138 RepID=UPI0022720C8C|nr:hypothetical protein [Roseateles sp. SL47]WAC73516.1 hypothetical protein OU995_01840 [Roseateles sp. SL47]